MHENILKKTNLLYRYCVIYFNFLSIGMHALEYCRMYELRHISTLGLQCSNCARTLEQLMCAR